MISRRTLLAALAGTGLVAALPAQALTEARAKRLVDALVGDIKQVISSGRSASAMYGDFERIFARYGDVPTIAAYALGNDGRRASAAQKRAFQQVFSSYLARKYGKRFREFIGGDIRVNGVRPVKSYYEVNCTAFLRGQSPFAVDFMVSDRSGREKFFNLKIEGVNMLLTERREIGALIDRNGGDIDRMISQLRGLG